jgi:hypothetical protein
VNDRQRALAHFFGCLRRLHEVRSSIDARQGIANLMRQAGRELANRGQPVRSLDLLEALLEIPVDLRQLPGSLLQFQALPCPHIGQNAGDRANQEEHDDLTVLVDGVFGHMMLPHHENVRYVAEG